MLVHDSGHSELSANESLRHSPPPTNVTASAGRRGSCAALTDRKRRQRCAPFFVQSASGLGSWPQRRVIFPGDTPVLSSASATERNDEPLSPGPSSTTRNP